jgi:hypothetical protein
MWESENQDESPLMTTDNFHGIDRLVGHSKYHPVPVRNAINPSPESDWLGRGPGRFVEFEWPVINAGDSVISKDDSRDTAIITIVQDEPEFIHPWINHYKSTSLMHNIQSHKRRWRAGSRLTRASWRSAPFDRKAFYGH